MISFKAKNKGFIHPPEWAPQEATWLSWPQNTETWQAEELKLVQKEYADFIAIISQFQQARILVHDVTMMDEVDFFLTHTTVKKENVKF